jgi:hypothetical protein
MAVDPGRHPVNHLAGRIGGHALGAETSPGKWIGRRCRPPARACHGRRRPVLPESQSPE